MQAINTNPIKYVPLMALQPKEPLRMILEKDELLKMFPHDLAPYWVDKICTYYNEPERYYHNWFHINRLLSEYKIYLEKTNSVLNHVLLYSIWFHDIVYNPKGAKGHNETESNYEFIKWVNEPNHEGFTKLRKKHV